jgi:uncharacterized protein YcbK (DUF882 family)
MTIHAMNRATIAPVDHSSARGIRSDSDHAPEEFAGMFAGALHATKQRPEAKKPEEGTSELDRQEDQKDEGVKKAKHGHTHHTPAASAVADAGASDDATTAAADASTDDIIQSTTALDPELQAKLARVASRVRDETGQDVKVAETYRSQGRQDALYAQGRETPGQVVTWTHNSKHTQGRAVDLVLDSAPSGFDAYKTLQRIAQEEGLRTLGAKDPGHLELPGPNGAVATQADVTPGAANDVTPSIPVEPADASGPGQVSIARLAQVAQVAQVSVARPAEVARVANVATIANVAKVQAPGTRGAPDSNIVTAPQPKHLATADAQNAAQQFSGSANGDSTSEERGGTSSEQRGKYSALAAAVALREGASFQSAIQDVTPTAGTSAADRAARLLAAYEDAPARPLSQITMSVDAGNGTTDRIQVAMRGASLNATIDAADSHGAQVMNSRADELVRALSKDGVTVDSLHVRAAVATAVGSTQQSSSSSDSSTHSRSERSNPWQQQDRQRSNQERRQQQRNPRGEEQ